MRASTHSITPASMTHIAWSTLGGFAGILAIERIGYLLGLSGYGYLFLIGSFGASAVLAYGIYKLNFPNPVI